MPVPALSAAPRPETVGASAYATDFRYTDRRSKAEYIARKYAPILRGSVLDVGCDRAPLRGLVGDAGRYVGVDIDPAGGTDVVLNLEEHNLPFADRSFDTVLCTDVLEHLERCHAVFDELCRVASERVIVSLPNPVRNLVQGLFEGTAGVMKFYGLPVDPPVDRHRWFFGHDEAKAFLTERGGRRGFEVEQLDVECVGSYYWLDKQGRDVLDHPNVRGGTMWCVLRRGERGTGDGPR